MKKQVHKLEVLIVDHDGLGEDDVVQTLETQKFPNWCIRPQVLRIRTAVVDWSDEHPLNKVGTQYAEVDRLFPPEALVVTCDMCDQVLTEPGALVFSPPSTDSRCYKRHVCADCEDMLTDFMADYRDNQKAKDANES